MEYSLDLIINNCIAFLTEYDEKMRIMDVLLLTGYGLYPYEPGFRPGYYGGYYKPGN